MLRPVMVVVVFAPSTLISGASLPTVMSCFAAAILRVKFTVRVSPKPAETDSFVCSSKPDAWTARVRQVLDATPGDGSCGIRAFHVDQRRLATDGDVLLRGGDPQSEIHRAGLAQAGEFHSED